MKKTLIHGHLGDSEPSFSSRCVFDRAGLHLSDCSHVTWRGLALIRKAQSVSALQSSLGETDTKQDDLSIRAFEAFLLV